MKEKIIDFDNKYATGFCKIANAETGQIGATSPNLDKRGGYAHPYVNLPSGETFIIKKGDKIKVSGKRVIEVIRV